MNNKILSDSVQDFIFQKSENAIDISKLILAGSPFEGITPQELAQQIQSRHKAKQKLPTWFHHKGIYYPPTLNLEQTSSEQTAHYKSQLIKGDTLIDLTGGFGIDDYYFTKTFSKVIHCELNASLSEIVAHNMSVMEIDTLFAHHGDGLELLKQQNSIDWIYIDPSRRNDVKGKVFLLEDCLPNVPEHLDTLFEYAPRIMIKTSPLLDIQNGKNALKNVKEIHCIALHNEVKELLWILEKDFGGEPILKTANLKKDTEIQEFSFYQSNEQSQQNFRSDIKTYLYEPNAAILKSGGFKSVASQFDITKLHQHSHLYSSDKCIDFPGRKFKIDQYLPYQKSSFKKMKISKANITTRNFPESVEQIRKKFKIKDGGDIYIFLTTTLEYGKTLLICSKIA